MALIGVWTSYKQWRHFVWVTACFAFGVHPWFVHQVEIRVNTIQRKVLGNLHRYLYLLMHLILLYRNHAIMYSNCNSKQTFGSHIWLQDKDELHVHTQTQTRTLFIQPHFIQSQFSHTFGFNIMGQGDLH